MYTAAAEIGVRRPNAGARQGGYGTARRTTALDMRRDWILLPLFLVLLSLLAAGTHYSVLKRVGVSPPVRSDGFWYYSYLPLYILNQRLDFESVTAPPFTFRTFPASPATRRLVNPYGIGTAVCELPFFLAAHGFTWMTGIYPADGYSRVYQLSVLASAFFYYGLGIAALWVFLRRWFSLPAVALSSALMTFGTSLFYYSTHMASFSHAYAFSVLSVFLWSGWRVGARASARSAVACGALLGLLFLIRPYNLLFGLLLVPLFVLTQGVSGWAEKIRLSAVITVSAAFVAAPQLMLWKHYFGTYLVNPYSVFPARLDFAHPFLYEVLFSVEKGVFWWAPVLLVALAGLTLMLFSRMWALALSSLLAIGMVTWVIASWPCWWLGEGFGHRGFVDTYPLFALGLAWVLHRTLSRLAFAVPVLAVCGMMAGVTVIQMGNYVDLLIPQELANQESYKCGLLRPLRRISNRIRFGNKTSLQKDGLIAQFRILEKTPSGEGTTPGQAIQLKMAIANVGSAIWCDAPGTGKVRLVSRWLGPAGAISRDSTDLVLEVGPGREWLAQCTTRAPMDKGHYELALDLESEGLGFFYQLGPSEGLRLPLEVRDSFTVLGLEGDGWMGPEGIVLSVPAPFVRPGLKLRMRGPSNAGSAGRREAELPNLAVRAVVENGGASKLLAEPSLRLDAQGYEIQIVLPSQVTPPTDGDLRIRLSFSDYFVPEALNMSHDKRKLSLWQPTETSIGF